MVDMSKGEKTIKWLSDTGISYGGEDHFAGAVFTVDAATAARVITAGQAVVAVEETPAEVVEEAPKKGKK